MCSEQHAPGRRSRAKACGLESDRVAALCPSRLTLRTRYFASEPAKAKPKQPRNLFQGGGAKNVASSGQREGEAPGAETARPGGPQAASGGGHYYYYLFSSYYDRYRYSYYHHYYYNYKIIMMNIL